MLRERGDLETIINKILKANATKKSELQNNVSVLKNVFGIEEKIGNDIMSMRRQVQTVDDRILFAVASVTNPESIAIYFTPKEIKDYSKKQKEKKFSFPIKWEMIQIADDQYVGKISVRELIQLRDAQLIHYNENAQRVMKKVAEGNDIIYQISINRPAVNGIKKSFLNNTYIPNTITLNIPTDEEFIYDGSELVINKLDHFDILDGYHRYIAMSEIYNINSDFDYDMELRIVAYPDEKARQFIWQEDQKTKMKKMDSESFNQNSYANQLVSLLNETPLLRGLFDIHGNINPALAGRMISITIFGQNKKYTRKELLDAKKYIADCFNELVTDYPNILDSEWNSKYVVSFFYAIWKSNDVCEVPGLTNKIFELSQGDHAYLFSHLSFEKRDLSRLDRILKEENYV